ncbi:uncharacterized protein TEOVI_000470500 [Trypanosoma equiperdum]|uniref:T. brucei spp.-specific protein n=4 Tax=Trypanozoon TaxID=39700 RepID=D6XF60_TRYB2|nr:hypothetical protein Tb927.4.1240 [Trypanosoma brucei brucei TREU927]AAZ10715.1 hypothetical protein Tb927.4.1240 [Trypanosoma brucei brucei TREU927]SCU66787.1 hypothetical protein, conserved [Trypanosoma equiperdum]
MSVRSDTFLGGRGSRVPSTGFNSQCAKTHAYQRGADGGFMGRKIYCQPVPLYCCSLLFMQWYPVTLMDASFLVTAITKQKKLEKIGLHSDHHHDFSHMAHMRLIFPRHVIFPVNELN